MLLYTNAVTEADGCEKKSTGKLYSQDCFMTNKHETSEHQVNVK